MLSNKDNRALKDLQSVSNTQIFLLFYLGFKAKLSNEDIL